MYCMKEKRKKMKEEQEKGEDVEEEECDEEENAEDEDEEEAIFLHEVNSRPIGARLGLYNTDQNM